MRERGLSLGAAAVVFVAGLIIAANSGLIGIDWPWEKVNLPDVLTEESAVAQTEEATIYEIEPIALDCRARIHAAVPVAGRRQHKALGATYRTDTVELTAIGDIDTCVDATDVAVLGTTETGFRVLVPASSVTFERPRVDAVATMDSVKFDKGFVGKITDVLPWVSDDSGLTPAAYAYAQQIIGSSECMERAWEVTEQVIVDAYEQQLIAQGGSAADISVEIMGVPSFDPPPDGTVERFEFDVIGEGISCQVDGDAYEYEVVDSPQA